MKNNIPITVETKTPFLHSIRFKIYQAVTFCGLILIIFSLWLLSDSMNLVERDLVDDRLASDIRYMRDELGEARGKAWTLKNGALYIGDMMLGDGTRENSNPSPFYHFERVTESFYYSFARTYNDDELEFVDSGNYQQGHYIRIAGTTKGPNGENLVGTYIDKQVADALENSPAGVYSGKANVNGRIIYCRYELIKSVRNEPIGVIVVGRSIEEMSTLVKTQKIRGFILIILAMTLMNIGLGIIITHMIGAINKIKARLSLIGTGVFPDEPLILKSRDEIGEIGHSINEMVESLKEKERIGAELDVATHIQSSMLPRIFPAFPEFSEFDIFATMNPAKEVGGDFYDFFMVDRSHLAVVIADVSGKGVPAALFMVIAKTLIKDHTQAGRNLGDVFTQVNNILCESNSEGFFVTAFEGVLDLVSGEFRYVNAGHELPFICRAGQNFEPYSTHPGFVLAGIEDTAYKSASIMLEPGDKLFLYTDGVTEATDASNHLFGMDRLGRTLHNNSNSGPSKLLSAVKSDIDIFVGNAPQFDDITMLCLEFKEKLMSAPECN